MLFSIKIGSGTVSASWEHVSDIEMHGLDWIAEGITRHPCRVHVQGDPPSVIRQDEE